MNYLDYFPVDRRRAGQLQALGGGIYSQWATGAFSDYWGMPTDWANATQEMFGLAVIDGEGWLTLRGFVPKVGPMHQLKTLKAIVTRNGVAKEIQCADGHPYALLTVQPFEVEIWGTVDGSMKFYWRATYAPVTEPNPILGESLACVEQREVWGNSDPMGGPWVWTRGGPTPPTAIPFDAAGKPVPIQTTMAGYQTIGKDYGPAWTLGTLVDGKKVMSAAANSHGWAW